MIIRKVKKEITYEASLNDTELRILLTALGEVAWDVIIEQLLAEDPRNPIVSREDIEGLYFALQSVE